MDVPAQDAPRLATGPERAIHEFDVYALPDDRWRAVYLFDKSLILEHDEWKELAWACVCVRIRGEIQRAAEELAERLGPCEHGRTSRVIGPGGGINV